MPLRLGEIGGLDRGVEGAVRDSLGPGFEMSTLELDLDGGAEPKHQNKSVLVVCFYGVAFPLEKPIRYA